MGICTRCNYSLPDDTPEWSTVCFNCYKEIKKEKEESPQRICKNCELPKISTLEPQWKQTCKDCYMYNKENARKCVRCKEHSILADRPAWIKLCMKCFLSGQACKRRCVVCKDFNINSALESWKTVCGECFKKKLKNECKQPRAITVK